MACNGLTDLVTTVSVPKSEYEELIRDSETLKIITNMVSSGHYFSAAIMNDILGISEEKESEE